MSGNPSFQGWYGAELGTWASYQHYWEGRLDEFHVFKKILTDTEIGALYNYAMLTSSEINTMLDLGEDFIDSLYLDMGDYAYIAEYPSLPMAVQNHAGGKADYILNDMDCKDYVSMEVNTIDYNFEKFYYTFHWGNDWLKFRVYTYFGSNWLQYVEITYWGKSSGFNDEIDVWFSDTKIFDNILNTHDIYDYWYNWFGQEYEEVGRIPAYRFAPRHMRQMGYKWYRNKYYMDRYAKLLYSLEREGWPDNYDIYDAMYGDEFTYSYYWTETDDFNSVYLWWDAYKPWPRDIYEEIKANSTYYPWDTSGKGGTYPYKSGIVGFLPEWMIYYLLDPLKWGLEANHLFCRYGADNAEKRAIALDNLNDCDFDGKGIDGGIQGWAPAYSTPRLAVWVAAASRWASEGYWLWDEVDQAAEILSMLQWSGEGLVYNDTSEEYINYYRTNIKGGFICSYICSEPVYSSYRPWIMTAIMDFADKYGIEEQMDDEYLGITIANFETSILAMLALQIYQYYRLS